MFGANEQIAWLWNASCQAAHVLCTRSTISAGLPSVAQRWRDGAGRTLDDRFTEGLEAYGKGAGCFRLPIPGRNDGRSVIVRRGRAILEAMTKIVL